MGYRGCQAIADDDINNDFYPSVQAGEIQVYEVYGSRIPNLRNKVQEFFLLGKR